VPVKGKDKIVSTIAAMVDFLSRVAARCL